MKYSQGGRGEAAGRTSEWGTWWCRRRCIVVWIVPSLARGRIGEEREEASSSEERILHDQALKTVKGLFIL